MEHFSNGAFLKWSNSQMERFSNGAILKWSNSQMERFSNGAILKWSNSQMEQFSNGAILKWSDSQMEQFSNGAIWGRHHQLDDSLVGQLTRWVNKVLQQKPPVLTSQSLPLVVRSGLRWRCSAHKSASCLRQHRKENSGLLLLVNKVKCTMYRQHLCQFDKLACLQSS